MMNIQQKRDLLMSLPLMEQEQRWIMERLDTLSVKEQYQLSAAILRTGKLEELAGKTGWELETAILHMDPEVAVDAVNCLLSLEDYQICFPAGSYAQLGSFYLRHESHLPERAMYYADLEALGRRYEDRHPGLFVGNCYVEYPEHPSAPRCTGQGLIPEYLSGLLMDKIGMTSLFPYATCFVALAFAAMLFVKHGDSRPQARSGIEALNYED